MRIPLSAQPSSTEDPLIKNAHAIHERVIVLDSHIDFEPADLIGERNYTQRVETQFNLPNMISGGLDALFFVIYVGQTRETQNPDALKAAGYQRAYHLAIEKFDAVHRFTGEIAHEKIELALTSSDVRRIYATGKKVALVGVEKAIRSAKTSAASKNSTTGAPATCRSPITVTISSPIRIPASATAGSGMAFRRSANKSSPK